MDGDQHKTVSTGLCHESFGLLTHPKYEVKDDPDGHFSSLPIPQSSQNGVAHIREVNAKLLLI